LNADKGKFIHYLYTIMPNIETKVEIRRLIIVAMQNGMGATRASEAFQTPYRTVLRIWQKFSTEGKFDKEQRGGYKRKLLTEEEIHGLQEVIDDDCSVTLESLRTLVEAVTGVSLSVQTIRNYIGSFRYTLKRVHVMAAAADTEVLWAQRHNFSLWMLQV